MPKSKYHVKINIPKSDKGSHVSVKLPDLQAGYYGIHLVIKTNEYPLVKHCCYMRHQSKESLEELDKLVFSEMDFKLSPPGIKTGPWPGWRGIPEMPDIYLVHNHKKVKGLYNFWGDEEYTNTCRILFYTKIDKVKDNCIILQIPEKEFSPLEISFYKNPKYLDLISQTEPLNNLPVSYPRLLFSKEQLSLLKKQKHTTHKEIWQKIEKLLNNQSIPFKLTPESKTLDGPERLNEMDRVVVNAFHALLSQEKASINKALHAWEHLLDLALSPQYEPMNIDTQSGECLFTLCIGYDWLYDHLPEKIKAANKQKLFQVADKVWQHLGYNRYDYGQAHFLGCSHGLLAFSFLFWQEHPRAMEWIKYLVAVFKHVIKMLPQDGFYPHGINLWIYEHTFLLRYLELLKQCTGIDLWSESRYWLNASLFRWASLSPDKKHGITFGDPQYRVSGDAWMHYLIASRTGSNQAQWLAKHLEPVETGSVDFRNTPPRRRVWEYLFFNHDIKSKPANKNTFYFPDGGQIFWKDIVHHKNITATFRSGSMLGSQRQQWGEWSGYGHSDPAQGAFLICDDNDLFICGPGPVYKRETGLHNTVTLNGCGQIGDKMVWAPEFIPDRHFPTTVQEKSTKHTERVHTDLTHIYPDHLGLIKFHRDFIYLKPDVFLIYDQIELDKERHIEWNIHSYSPIEMIKKNSLSFQLTNKKSVNITCLSPDAPGYQTGLSEFVPAYPNPGKRDYFLKLDHTGNNVTFLVMITLKPTRYKCEITSKEPTKTITLYFHDQKEELIFESK